jgi:uncharacterized protein YjbI with pentapeptide repeats/DNA-binding Xre family transcriptional regulator
MSRSIRVRPDLVLRVRSAVKHNGFLRQKDLVEEVGLASSTVRNFLNGKLVDYATFVELCQRLNLEWRDFADLGEITELYQESKEPVIARYSTSETEKTTPDTLDLAEREEAIAKPNIQIEQSNTDLIEERIFRATEQLNRRGFSALVGIQALEEIAKDSSRYHWKIMELLAAFVRNAPLRKEEEGISDDIQAALTVIGQRDPEKDPPNKKLDLSNTDIRGANLRKANFRKVILSGAKLQEAKLPKANLQGADLSRANLEKADLSETDLQEADLREVNLKRADLSKANLEKAILRAAILNDTTLNKANLQRADLRFASLQGAYLDEANLQEADLSNAKLQGIPLGDELQKTHLNKANLQGANFIGASLDNANLQGSNFSKAKLERARLFRADLQGAINLKQQQIEQALGNSTTVLPDDVEKPAHWM